MPHNNHHDASNSGGDATKVSASRVINAPATDIFDILSNPQRHAQTDGGGQVISADFGERLKQVGDTFRMNMRNDAGEYQTENEVFAFVDGRTIGWKNLQNLTNGVQVGSKWLYELAPEGAGATTVTLTYDPSEIDNPMVQKVAAQYTADALEKSLEALADAVA